MIVTKYSSLCWVQNLSDSEDKSDEGGSSIVERKPYDGPSISITKELKTSYLDYAMSVIVSRAIPDLRTA